MLSFAKAVWNLVIGLIISIYLLASKERFVSQERSFYTLSGIPDRLM